MNKIKVLVVDDSAFARKVIREVLMRDPHIEVVGIARDGIEALEKIIELKPDVVTLDLVMPDLDGIGLLRALPKDNFPSVLIVSVSGGETDLALEALSLGAVDIITKPTAHATDRLYELAAELVSKVKIAALAKPRVVKPAHTSEELKKKLAHIGPISSKVKLVVIGTSTGGPQALAALFKSLPEGLDVPIAVALHIPAGYTAPMADRISQNSFVKMSEAKDGMELLPGHAVIAPGGLHLRVRAENERLYCVVSSSPTDTLHHPSVNELFQSAAEAVGTGALGVVLTGMGNDGMVGSEAINKAGGSVIAESASSCVVYGMPRSVIEAGLTVGEAPLEQFAGFLVDHIYGRANHKS